MEKGPEKLEKPADLTRKPREHLRPGVKPIMVCVGTDEDFDKEGRAFFRKKFTDKRRKNVSNVDWQGNPATLDQKRYSHAGFHSYVISTIDSTDKFSESFLNCTGLVVSGLDKNTKKIFLSFLINIQVVFYMETRGSLSVI